MSYLGSTKIGKMYLGSTEIGKAYLGGILVFQSGGSPTPVGPGGISDYVQSGLVMHMDGIEKGNTAGRWSSYVGSSYATLTSHATIESNAVLMDGAGYLTVSNAVAVGYSAGTIEVCCENFGTASTAIYYGTSGRISFIYSGAGYVFGVTSSNNQWSVEKIAKITASANSDRLMLNGVVCGTLTSNSFGDASTTSIGGRGGTAGSRLYADARIYSIRIYNRKLTEEEMLQNQKVDNVRFRLGLDIQ